MTGTVEAVVLTGGRGRRLGGAAKAALDVGDGPLLEGVLNGVAAAGVGRAVVVGPGPDRQPDGLEVVVTREDPPFGGPAAGVAAALPLVGAPWVLLLACDLPRGAALVQLLLDAWRTDDDGDGVVVVDHDQHPQWLAGVYRRAALARALGEALSEARTTTGPASRGLRVADVAGRLRLQHVPDTGGVSKDVDTPADLAWWRTIGTGDAAGAAPGGTRETTVEQEPTKGGRVPAGALGAWLAELQQVLGTDEQVDVDLVLDVARDVAHGIARPAAPLSTFALGLAVGRRTAPDEPIGDELTRLARLVQQRALRDQEPATDGGPA